VSLRNDGSMSDSVNAPDNPGFITLPPQADASASLRRLRCAESTVTKAFALLNCQPKKACDIWTRLEWSGLCNHLHNANEPTAYVMGFRKDGCKKYVRAKRVPASRAISWSWSSMVGQPKSKLAFVPYSTNENRQSRWGGMDFDAHSGQTDRARELALAAFRCLLNHPELFIILESSGSGGYHVWAISEEFRPVLDWIRFLKSIAAFIGAPIQAGTCEIFPPDSLPTRYGKGMRAPGCWNPSTETLSEIYWQNCHPLLASLSRNSKRQPLSRNELQSEFPDKERSVSFPSLSSSPQSLYRATEWLERFAITQTGTRNDMLAKLVGEVFHQVGHDTAARLAEAQFQSKTVATNARLDEHLASFRELWRGMEQRWQASLSGAENEVFHALETGNERDAFRIVRSFALKAEQDGAPDFPLARDNLGLRLGITGPGAAAIRDKLAQLKAIEKTQAYQPNKAATRFRWLPVR
jgi:hypothetical protein